MAKPPEGDPGSPSPQDRTAIRFRRATGQYANFLWLFALGMLWGASYLFIKVAVAEVSAWTLVAGRMLLAAVIMWVVIRASGISMPRSQRLWGAYAVMGFFSGALPLTAFLFLRLSGFQSNLMLTKHPL